MSLLLRIIIFSFDLVNGTFPVPNCTELPDGFYENNQACTKEYYECNQGTLHTCQCNGNKYFHQPTNKCIADRSNILSCKCTDESGIWVGDINTCVMALNTGMTWDDAFKKCKEKGKQWHTEMTGRLVHVTNDQISEAVYDAVSQDHEKHWIGMREIPGTDPNDISKQRFAWWLDDDKYKNATYPVTKWANQLSKVQEMSLDNEKDEECGIYRKSDKKLDNHKCHHNYHMAVCEIFYDKCVRNGQLCPGLSICIPDTQYKMGCAFCDSSIYACPTTLTTTTSTTTPTTCMTTPTTTTSTTTPTTTTSTTTLTTTTSTTTLTTTTTTTTPTTTTSTTTPTTTKISTTMTTPTTTTSTTTPTTTTTTSTTTPTTTKSTTTMTTPTTTTSTTTPTTTTTTSTTTPTTSATTPTTTNSTTTMTTLTTGTSTTTTTPKNQSTDANTKATAISNCSLPMSGTLCIASKIIQSIGCTYLIIALSSSIIIYLILSDFSHERCLHMSQEIALLSAHLFIAFFWKKTEINFIRKFAVFGIQYFFLAMFIFIALEAVHYFNILTNVIRKGAYFNRLQVQIIGWSLPAVLVVLTSLGHEYILPPWSCWLNYGNEIALTTVMPIVICTVITTVMTEAAGGMHKKLPPVVNVCKIQKTAALANRSAMIVLLPLQVSAWAFGSYAVYRMHFWMFPTVMALNISLGSAIFIFHTLGNPKVHELFCRHVVDRFKKRKVNPSTEDGKPKRKMMEPLSTKLVNKIDDKINHRSTTRKIIPPAVELKAKAPKKTIRLRKKMKPLSPRLVQKIDGNTENAITLV